jgi:hypothetical protein
LLGQRWYDSEVGRFISRDPAINTINYYIYCFNNPLKLTDPIGLDAEEECYKNAQNQLRECLKKASEFWDEMVKLCEEATKVCGIRLPDIWGGCMQECLGLIPSRYYNYPPGASPVDTFEKMVKKCDEDYKNAIEKCKKKKCNR